MLQYTNANINVLNGAMKIKNDKASKFSWVNHDSTIWGSGSALSVSIWSPNYVPDPLAPAWPNSGADDPIASLCARSEPSARSPVPEWIYSNPIGTSASLWSTPYAGPSVLTWLNGDHGLSSATWLEDDLSASTLLFPPMPKPPLFTRCCLPKNYRTHGFNLFGRHLMIGGMAGPHNNDSIDGALSYLRVNEGRVVLIGLHENDFTKEAHRNGLEYHYIPILDFSSQPVPPEKYDAIYAVIKKSTEEGKLVSIHCGVGDGRTGTALAALKIRELLEQDAEINPLILEEEPQNTSLVFATLSHSDVPCTPIVKRAVEGLRHDRESSDESGSLSVETLSDIQTLIEYESHLRLVIKAELEVSKENDLAKITKLLASASLGSGAEATSRFPERPLPGIWFSLRPSRAIGAANTEARGLTDNTLNKNNDDSNDEGHSRTLII